MPIAKTRQYVRKRDGKKRVQFTIWICETLMPALEHLETRSGKGKTTLLAEFAEAGLKRVKIPCPLCK